MTRTIIIFLAIMAAVLFSMAVMAEARQMDTNQSLNGRQQAIVPIAAFTATGDLERLKTALHEGLEPV